MEEEFYNWPADLLADYIVKVHHKKIRERVVGIKEELNELLSMQNTHASALNEAANTFLQLVKKMEIHFSKEAVTVLPFARRYAKALKKQNQPGKVRIQSACPSIHKMYLAHKAESLNFSLLLAVMKHVVLDEESALKHENICNNIILLKKLWETEVQLENDILFPKIVEMEARLSPIQKL